MRRALRLGRFRFRVRWSLALAVLGVLTLCASGIYVVEDFARALEAAEREVLRARVAAFAAPLDRAALLEALQARGRPAAEAWLRRLTLRSGFARACLVDRAGTTRVASGPPLGDPPSLLDLSPEARAALEAGRTVVAGPLGRGDSIRMLAWAPVHEASGRLAGALGVEVPVPRLAAARRRTRLAVAGFAFAALCSVSLAAVAGRWIRRPYDALAEAARSVGLDAGPGASEEPEELVGAFRAMVQRLRRQEQALEALGRGGTGLGDLVRFAAGAARGMVTGVIVVDRRRRVAAMNPAAAALLGVKEDEARHRPLAEVLGHVEGLGPRIERCLEEGRAVSREVLRAVRDGSRSHLGVAISPVPGSDERVAGAIVLLSDLTEIRALETQTRVRERWAVVGRLAAAIAHELRNALGTILGWAKHLAKHPEPRVRGPAREILREVEHLTTVLEDILLYARPSAAEPTPVLLERVVRRAASTAPERVEVEVVGGFGCVLGDEPRLQRVFENLLRNAAETLGEAGEVRRVRIEGRVRADTIEITVDDDGPGIPESERERVFEPFVSDKAAGTGLGLALVERTLEDLGGTVRVGSSPLGGARFVLQFPSATGPVTKRDASRSPAT